MATLEQAQKDIRVKRGLDEAEAPVVEAADPVDVPADDPGLAAEPEADDDSDG